MAIQFNCPQCGATLKVPDAASGKKGTCPKCGIALLVPKLAIPEASQFAGAEPEAPAEPPEAPFNLESRPENESDDPLAFLAKVEPIPTVAVPHESPAVRRLRRRRAGWLGILIPLVFGAAFLGAAGWFYFREAVPRLEGTLKAVALDETQPPAGFITGEDVDLPEDVFAQILQDTKAKPLPDLRSNLMEVDFEPGEKAIEVRLRATPETQFFRVDPDRSPALRKFRNEHGTALAAERRREFTAAAKAMIEDWQQSGDAGFDAAPYRDSVGLNALLGSLGYHLQAVVDERIYRCVAEDGEGRVYFLLPPGTRRFRIEGRPLDDGRVMFPGKYTAKVAKEEAAVPEKAVPESPMETETGEPASDPASDSQ